MGKNMIKKKKKMIFNDRGKVEGRKTSIKSIIQTNNDSKLLAAPKSFQKRSNNSSRVISPSHSPQSTKHSTHSTSENIVELVIHVSMKKIKELEKALETVEFERKVEREKRMKYENLISVLVEHQKIDSHENS